MNIQVIYFAQVRVALGGRASEARELPDGATVADLVAMVSAEHPSFAPLAASILATIDQNWAKPGDTIPAGSTVGLMPPVSGG